MSDASPRTPVPGTAEPEAIPPQTQTAVPGAQALVDQLRAGHPEFGHTPGDQLAQWQREIRSLWVLNLQSCLAGYVPQLLAHIEWLTERLLSVNRLQEVADLDWQGWSNELADEMPTSWEGDDPQESIVLAYVREMERRLDAAGISRERRPPTPDRRYAAADVDLVEPPAPWEPQPYGDVDDPDRCAHGWAALCTAPECARPQGGGA